MTTYLDPRCARVPAAPTGAHRGTTFRVVALGVAVGIASFLIGLSAARNALPGDTFQLTPRAHASSVAPGLTADPTPHGKPGASATQRLGDLGWLIAVLPRPPRLAADRVAAGAVISFCALVLAAAASAAGCRGPPLLSALR